ncbi:MAG TPA: DUF1501 domain-containing protein [Mycobacteriales bacterium]|nr:DUF1501 domain-containing protein [Mycobacteriales bacterium]
MTVTRRTFIKGAGAAAGVLTLSPWLTGLASGVVDPRTRTRRRLVVIDLGGGNDGLNTVVPRTGSNRQVYTQVRPTIQQSVGSLLPLDRGGRDDGSVGFHGSLKALHQLYREDRVAVVQGVDYPNHNYSHFTSNDIWQAGNPDNIADAGWIGRHLDRCGVPVGELRAVGIGGSFAHALRGRVHSGAQVDSFAATHFLDGDTPVARARHDVYGRFAQHAATEPVRASYGAMCGGVVDLDTATRGLSSPTSGSVLADQMLTARTLLEHDLGVEVVFVSTGGYDTHANQLTTQQSLLADLDQALEAFFYGTKAGVPITVGGVAGNGLPAPVGTPTVPGTPIGPLSGDVAAGTLVMTFSEFGRRIGENASGTDHGAAAPMLMVGPPPPAPGTGVPALVPGLHGDHPDMGSPALPADNLGMTTDLRSVYQAVLTKWINDPASERPDEGDPAFRLSGPSVESDGSLAGLFATA